jgi:hypothetical protein
MRKERVREYIKLLVRKTLRKQRFWKPSVWDLREIEHGNVQLHNLVLTVFSLQTVFYYGPGGTHPSTFLTSCVRST